MENKNSLLVAFFGGAILSLAVTYSYLTSNTKKQSKKKILCEKQFVDSPQYQNIKNQQLARVIKYFGEQKFHKLEKSYVIVFGVGGVGSHVVNMLARSGIERIKIVDFDRVSLSSLNRHSFAVRQDVGTSKVQCIKKYINKILPHIKIETVEKYVTVENAASLLDQSADYVVDCIDNLDAKCQIISVCKANNIRMIVSGGAGMKADPTKLQIRDISDVKYDNLIMRLKRQLKTKGIKGGVKVAFSYEQAQKELLPLNEKQQANPDSYRVFDNYRIRIIPVLGTMPAILGMSIASYILCDLAGEAYQPFETDYIKSTMMNRLYNQLVNDQRKRGVSIKQMDVDMEQIALIAKQVYKWECLITGKKQSSPRILRWNPQKPATIENLTFMGKQNYQKHLKLKSLGQIQKYYSSEIQEKFKEKSKKGKNLLDSGYCVFV